MFQLTIGTTNISGVTSYDKLDVRFRLAFERVQRAHPELLNELSQRLPLVPSDEALEALATEHGWHASFFRPQALVLAKAPDSGDVGRLLMKAPAVASKAPAMLANPAGIAGTPLSIVSGSPVLGQIRLPPPDSSCQAAAGCS